MTLALPDPTLTALLAAQDIAYAESRIVPLGVV
jgi:hypothetical protein